MKYAICNIVLVPFLLWSRWNGPALIFDVLLAAYLISGILFIEGK